MRAEVARRRADGESIRHIAAALGLGTRTVLRWIHEPEARPPDQRCWRCFGIELEGQRRRRYVYLLGQYLGDGHLVTRAHVPVLRIYTCTDYPGIVEQTRAAVRAVVGVSPGTVHPAKTDRMVILQSYWKHWPCVFPQHGPGRKHERPIVLEPWQQEIVEADPWPLIRGLIHSDGCRAINRVVVHGRAYSYPRYFFANESRDILGIAGRALDLAGVAWRFNRPNSISVARRDAVALMEEHVGPKT